MEKRHGSKAFEWAELEREYRKTFDIQMPRDDISVVLATVFGGQPRRDVRSFVSQLQSVFYLVKEWRAIPMYNPAVDPANPFPNGMCLVQCLTTLVLSKKDASAVPHGRIGLAYEAFKTAEARKEKRMLKGGDENIDDDEPEIKKVKTEDDEEPEVKEEPEDPSNEVEIKMEVKEEEPDHK